MIFDRFTAICVDHWTNYFRWLSRQEAEGKIDLFSRAIFYPSMLLVTKTPAHYIMELLGAQRRFDGLTVKRTKIDSAERYFSQFDASTPTPILLWNVKCSEYRGGCLAHEVDFQEVAARFPQIKNRGTTLIAPHGSGGVVAFGDDFESCSMEQCLLVNKKDGLVRCKTILHSVVIRSNLQPAELESFLRQIVQTNFVRAATIVDDANGERLAAAGQLQSLYFSTAHETTIGEFLRQHTSLLEVALGARRIVHEPTLEWIDHAESCHDESINPDMLVEIEAGKWDIYDLKTGLVGRRNITRGDHRRRRFVGPVYEGIAQLANYKSYFEFPANVEHARKKYGIDVMAPPRGVLVVGSWENVDATHVGEALRAMDDSYSIIDYDTLCQLITGTNEAAFSPSAI